MCCAFWLDLTNQVSGTQTPPGIWLFLVKLFVLMYLFSHSEHN